MPLDENDLKKVGELIAGALKTHGEESAKATEALVGKVVTAKLGDVTKTIETLKTDTEKRFEGLPKPQDPPKDDKGGKGGAGGSSIQDDPAFKKLQADLEAERKRADEQARKAKEQEEARQAQHLRQSLLDALTAQGVDPKRVKDAADLLIARQVVKLNDKGEPIWPLKRNWGEEPVAVKDAAKEWLATDDGKHWLPPVGTQGTGDGAGKTSTTVGGDTMTAEQALGAVMGRLF